MKKTVGVAIIAIVIIVGVAYLLSSTELNSGNLPETEDLISDEIALTEVVDSEEPESTGREISIEFNEKIGLKSP